MPFTDQNLQENWTANFSSHVGGTTEYCFFASHIAN